MKRRNFIRTSVEAGVAVSTSYAVPFDAFVPLRPQVASNTLYDKIWNVHVVANLGGNTDLLQVDRNIMFDGGSRDCA